MVVLGLSYTAVLMRFLLHIVQGGQKVDFARSRRVSESFITAAVISRSVDFPTLISKIFGRLIFGNLIFGLRFSDEIFIDFGQNFGHFQTSE